MVLTTLAVVMVVSTPRAIEPPGRHGDPPLIIRYLSRVVLVPVIATISYEYIRFMARNMQNPIVRAMVLPQLALQKLTTREPSPDMLEVSIAALQRVLAAEQLPVAPAEAVPVEAR